MATKSFTTDFTFNAKQSENLIKAIEGSKRVDHELGIRVDYVTDEKELDALMDAFIEGTS